jgi:hypothetical protein
MKEFCNFIKISNFNVQLDNKFITKTDQVLSIRIAIICIIPITYSTHIIIITRVFVIAMNYQMYNKY